METTWTGSLHQTFRILASPSGSLVPFLSSHGQTPAQVLAQLPYESNRAIARGGGTGGPDPKRYRDARQVYQTIGLVYESHSGLLQVTSLGTTTLRWLSLINTANAVVLGRHVAYALSACQLRNPTGAGQRYDPCMEVFPFQFIWRAMLQLDGKISSDELNRELFRVKNEVDLQQSIDRIAHARSTGNNSTLQSEVITGDRKNDRIIPWMSLASFGWTLFPDKGGSNYYQLPERTLDVIKQAAMIKRKHLTFPDVPQYIEYLSTCACLPKDLR